MGTTVSSYSDSVRHCLTKTLEVFNLRTMRLFMILLVLAGATTLAPAETNSTQEIRKMSLDDCIQAALERNLDLRIAQITVPKALAVLQGAKGGWAPTFTPKA